MKAVNKDRVVGALFGFFSGIAVILLAGFFIFGLPIFGGFELPPPDMPVSNTINLDWSIQSLDRTDILISHQYKDQLIFLNFWATWCRPCVDEMPGIEKLYQRYNGRVAFICATKDTIEAIDTFRKKSGYTFPMYHLTEDPPKELVSFGLPATYIISPNKEVLVKHLGAADWNHQSVIDLLDRLLAEPTEPVR